MLDKSSPGKTIHPPPKRRHPIMHRLRWSLGLLAVAVAALVVNTASAERVPSRKTIAPTVSTAKNDITVPYTTNGNTTLGVWQGVSPRIYSSPDVEDSKYPDTRRVYNLPFWGGVQSFGGKSEGAVPRLPGPPYPGK
jgi:hypothetical protein